MTKSVYIPAPCGAYDIEVTQLWLEEMAGRGLMLTHDGFFAGIGIFSKGKSTHMRYRLDVRHEKKGLFDDGSDRPDDELTETYKSLGWEYVASRGGFRIFRTADPDARELNTDRAVQAEAVNTLRKNAVLNAILWVIWLILCPVRIIFEKPVINAVEFGPFITIVSVAVFCVAAAHLAARTFTLARFWKKLVAPVPATDEAPRKVKPWRRTVLNACTAALIAVWIISLLSAWSRNVTGNDGSVPLESFSGSVPFATIGTLSKGEYSILPMDFTNTVRITKNAFCAEAIEWNESALIKREDSTTFDAGLHVQYFELLSPWLAREAARELEADYRDNEVYPLPALDADHAAAYTDHTFLHLIIQRGCKVMHVLFYQTSSDYSMPLDEFIKLEAESIG